LGLGFIVLYIALAMTGGIINDILIYGAAPAPAVMVPLPLWGTLYSLVVWPLIWAFAEEMTYQGYALPRLETLTGRSWLAVVIIGFGWALQHIALPWMPDWRWALYRFGSSLLIGMVLPIIYLKTRRLAPFIIAHWAANFSAVLMTVVVPMATV
jgi:membrane protease YdiL (CAAX protease family)